MELLDIKCNAQTEDIMEIRNMISFQKICELNSFSRAALELGYSQSTVTMQIKQLENELQVNLFDRIGKTIHLTEDGRKFLTYANEIIQTANNARQALNKDCTPKGDIRIGILESVCTAYLPGILNQLHVSYPLISTIIKIGTFDELANMLNANLIDILWTFDLPIEIKEWSKVYSYTNDICIISSSDNKLASTKMLYLKDIKGETFILTEHSCSYRNIFEKKLNVFDTQPAVFLEIGNTEIIKKFVAANLGISVLPRFAVSEELLSGKVVCLNISDFNLEMEGQLFVHKNKWITPGLKALINLIQNLEDN